MPSSSPKPADPPLSQALSSERFAHKIDMLHEAKAHELLYLKLGDFLDRTTHMLGLESEESGLRYAGKAKSAVERINRPLIASIYQGVDTHEVDSFVSTLHALPAVRKDKDYQMASKALIRASGTIRRVKNDFPGFEPAWDSFFGEDLNPVFQGLPNLVDPGDVERLHLFEALASIASGDVPYDLEPHRKALEEAHEAFQEGDSEQLADRLFGITQLLTHNPPPKPPGEGDDSDDEDDDCSGEDESEGQGKGGGGGSGGGGGGEQEEEEETKNPFEDLGEYMNNADDTKTPDSIGAEDQFNPDETPEDIDIDKLRDLKGLKADVGVPKTLDGKAWVYHEVLTPPESSKIWGQQNRLYHKEITEVRRIIDEVFRTNTIIERGLRSGRADSSRLYRAAFNDPEIFRREEIDSVGHMELVVIIDESGSMTAQDKREGFRLLPGSNAETRYTGFENDEDYFTGKAARGMNGDRTSIARIMASILLEASRHLAGFHVEVAGYGLMSASNMGPLQSVGEAVSKKIRGGSAWGGGSAPFVRRLGTTEHPYGVLSTNAFAGNADVEGLAYAVEKLEHSHAQQKGIIYLADGHAWDAEGHMDKLIKRARMNGIQIYFMNLAGSSVYEGALSKLPSTVVNNFKDMITGLKKFLHQVVASV